MSEQMWKCDKCGKEREKSVPGLVITYPPAFRISQPCECGGQYWLWNKNASDEIEPLRARIAYLEKVRIAAQEFINATEKAHDLSTVCECQDALAAALSEKE